MPSIGLDIQTHQPVQQHAPGLLPEKGSLRKDAPPHGLLGTHTQRRSCPSTTQDPPSCDGLCVAWNSGGLEEKGVVQPPLCFLQPGGCGRVSVISVSHLPSPSGSPSGLPTQAALLQSTTTPLTETLLGLLEAGGWLWQGGSGLPTGIQLQYASDFHLSRNQPGNAHDVTGQLPTGV